MPSGPIRRLTHVLGKCRPPPSFGETNSMARTTACQESHARRAPKTLVTPRPPAKLPRSSKPALGGASSGSGQFAPGLPRQRHIPIIHIPCKWKLTPGAGPRLSRGPRPSWAANLGHRPPKKSANIIFVRLYPSCLPLPICHIITYRSLYQSINQSFYLSVHLHRPWSGSHSWTCRSPRADSHSQAL